MTFELFQSTEDKNFHFTIKTAKDQVFLRSDAFTDLATCQKAVVWIQENSQNPNCFTRKKASNNKIYFEFHGFGTQVLGTSIFYSDEKQMEEDIATLAQSAAQAKIKII